MKLYHYQNDALVSSFTFSHSSGTSISINSNLNTRKADSISIHANVDYWTKEEALELEKFLKSFGKSNFRFQCIKDDTNIVCENCLQPIVKNELSIMQSMFSLNFEMKVMFESYSIYCN